VNEYRRGPRQDIVRVLRGRGVTRSLKHGYRSQFSDSI
jgi:hypothetical protein